MSDEHRKSSDVRGYRQLIAWQKALDLADRVYEVSDEWPTRERFGLADQTRRASASVPANIAEGYGRGTPGDYARFLAIAYGSICELETHLYLAQRRSYLDLSTLERLIDQSTEVARLIRGLSKAIKARSSNSISEEEAAYEVDSE